MFKILTPLLLTAALMMPTVATAAPAQAGSLEWHSYSASEKAAYLKGVSAGIVTGDTVMSVMGHGLPSKPEVLAFQSFVTAHQNDLLAYLDKAYANPKEQSGVGALVASYYFAHDANAQRKLDETSRARMQQLKLLAPKK
ncbi:MAG: hypothetical protein JWM80_5082 [Cyanobacteria bacterium RYN_339]|nr:hypothetical protein [Cyanobacteria bacterium RYN_339]